ncbi:MAG: hypothetical protein QW038_02905 [Nanopusillaceae archaeon]
MDISINDNLINYISSLVSENKRFDGRNFLEYRKIKIVDNYIENAEGSSYIELGNTKVLVGIKLDIDEPFPDSPNDGIFIVSLEYLPGSIYEKEPGPPTPEEIEYARVIDRIIRGAHFIKTENLVVESGKYVWVIYIDIYVINNDGNLIDASLLATVRALKNTKFPELIKDGDKYVINYKKKTNKNLPLNLEKMPVSITFAKIFDKFIVDPTLYEERSADSIVNIGLTESINNIQFLKSEGIELEELDNLIEIAKNKRKELLKYI